jgi:CBS domain-containing protein
MAEIEYLKKVFGDIRVKDIMNPDVVTVLEGSTPSKALDKFLNNSVSHLIVVDFNKKVVGLLSQKYLYRTQSPRKINPSITDFDPDIIIDRDAYFDREALDGYRLSSIMKENPLTVRPGESVIKVVQMMSDYNLGCVPVTDKDGYISGVVTHKEIVDFLAGIFKA